MRLCTTKQLSWSNEKLNLLGIDVGHEQIVTNNYESIVDKVIKIDSIRGDTMG